MGVKSDGRSVEFSFSLPNVLGIDINGGDVVVVLRDMNENLGRVARYLHDVYLSIESLDKTLRTFGNDEFNDTVMNKMIKK